MVVITDAENMMGDNLGQSPLSSVNDGDDKTLQGVKANENEVNGTSARDVSQWKLIRVEDRFQEDPYQKEMYTQYILLRITVSTKMQLSWVLMLHCSIIGWSLFMKRRCGFDK